MDKQRVLFETLYRQHHSMLVSLLVRYFGIKNIALAEDIVQDTFETALIHWAQDKLPDDPSAWLFRVCKHKALNMIQRKSTAVVELSVEKGEADQALDQLFLDHEIKDSQLRLLFASCSPDLSAVSQVIVILKNLCGFKVDQIARGMAMSEEAVMKTLSRSRHTLAENPSSVQVPFLDLSRERLPTVHLAIYLMFNEGYAATKGDVLIRRELCIEAMRLGRSILEMDSIRNHDTYAVMSLMCFHVARFDARTGTGGELIELEQQDRSKWDKEMIALGTQYLDVVRNTGQTSRYVMEASIAWLHSTADRFSDTRWTVIAGLNEQLTKIHPSPFADLNYAIALYFSRGTTAALNFMKRSLHLTWLKNYYLYYAFLGKIYAEDHKFQDAILNYEKALSLSQLKADREFLKSKISLLQGKGRS